MPHLTLDDLHLKLGVKMNRKKLIVLISSFFILTNVLIAGIPQFFQSSGSKSLALNGIYAAGVDGISNLSKNPAGLSYLKGRAIELSVYGKLGQNEYNNFNGNLFKSYRDDDVNIDFGAFWNVYNNITIGLDYNNSMQYKVNWPYATYTQGDSLSAILAFELFNEFSFTSINPSVSYNFGGFSLGISVNIVNIKHNLGFYQGDPNWENKEGGVPAYQVNYNSDSWAFGGTIGLLAEITNSINVGAYLKSPVNSTLKGTAETNLLGFIDSTDTKTSLSSDFQLPWILGCGIIYDVNEKLKLNIDAQYNLWSNTNSSQIYSFNNNLWQNRLSKTDTISGYSGSNTLLNYKNSLDAGIGLEYFANNDLTLRFGYRYSQTQFSESTYSMLYPSINQHWFSIGVGFWFEELYLDMAILYAMGIEKEIIQDKNQFFPGIYKGDAFLPSINIKYQL